MTDTILNINALQAIAITSATEASRVILEVYNSGDFQAEAKGDNSPLTIADKRGHEVISRLLRETGLPVLSEEGKAIPFDERKDWEYFWMVDPLDGTKEFIKRNGEFTVNIALIHRNTPVMGVVAVPATGEIFYASKDQGAFLEKNGETTKLARRSSANLSESGLRVVASRSHMNKETEDFIQSLKDPSLVSAGSSLKFLLLAKGEADVYPRYAPTMEWDTAAAHAIVSAVGFNVYQYGTDQPLIYNKPDLLNPYFLVK